MQRVLSDNVSPNIAVLYGGDSKDSSSGQ